MSLTPKQEKFCQCIVSGMSKKDSYKAAYNCNTDRIASNESNVLLQRDDITERIKELNKPLINHAQNTAISEREKKRNIIWEELENARTQQDHNAVARYMDILNKMDSEYINTTRIESDNKTAITGLDTDTLKQLITNKKDL